MIKIEMENFIIRDYIETDLDGYIDLFTNSQVQHYLPHLQNISEEELKSDFEDTIKDIENTNRKKFLFALIDKGTNEYMGEVGFIVTKESPKGKRVEMGYFILLKYQGKGYVTKGVERVIQFAFEKCGVHKIVAGCIKDNQASEKVMQKCGMRKEGEFIEHVWLHGSWRDNVRYGLLKEDWKLEKR